MQAITIARPGGPDVLRLAEVPEPAPANGEILVRIHAVGVNRADLIQRAGRYPAPKDAPQDIPGLEYSGEVVGVGRGVEEWRPGDRVFGLAGGGTYAQYVCVCARTAARIPEKLDYIQAAAVPEAFVTAYDAMVLQCKLSPGERVLVTAAGSGVGTAAIQIASAIGALPFGTARSQSKLDAASKLGMQSGFLAESGHYAQAVLKACPEGMDVIVELVGGPLIVEDIACAANQGRIVLVGLLGGAQAQLDLGQILRKRLTIKGTTLRMRPLEEKIAAGKLLARQICPLLEQGRLHTVIDSVFALAEAGAAHSYLENNANFGKVVLAV